MSTYRVHSHFGSVLGPIKIIRATHFVRNNWFRVPVKNQFFRVSVKESTKHPTLLQNIGLDSEAKLYVS